MKSREAAWAEFSRFIRLRDALITTGHMMEAECITCGRRYPIEGRGSIQAGHFLPGRHDAVLFDEQGVNAQCYRCNVTRSGMWPTYYEKMVSMYGPGILDEMLVKWHDHATNYSVEEYHAIELKYRAKTALLRTEFKRQGESK
jgi:hypothetical protein